LIIDKYLSTKHIENHGPVKLFTNMYIMAFTVNCTLELTVVWLIWHFVALFLFK